ncbi:MAG: hypothetical protein BGO77_05445 [Caedibacter sp. 37-49]|nr:MAG: hypothetical protein BGO77_05445 [Caedibacter sp. 37-49]
MTPCENYLRAFLKETKWLSTHDFMKIALQDPKYGYYAQQQAIGVQNDFITAPEISQLFGETLGFWLLSRWEQLGCPSPFILLELGPGRGTLLTDLLRIASQKNDFINGLHLYLVDINPHLKENQKAALSKYKPQWFDSLADALEMSQELPMFIIANEFLDAFPIHQYELTSSGWYERGVHINSQDKLAFSLNETSLDFMNISFPHPLKPGDIYEICPEAINIIQQIGSYLNQHQGTALFIDYGYTEGIGDTFQALYKHQYISPFDHLGEADLTAHVNFNMLIKTLNKFPTLIKYIALQSDFLKSWGIEMWTEKLMQNASLSQKNSMVKGLNRLLSTYQMGSLFKVLEVYTAC